MEAFVVPEIEWSALLPFIAIVATALVVLVAEMFLPRDRHAPLIALGLVGIGIAGYFQVANWEVNLTTFAGALRADSLGAILNLAILGATALTLLLSDDYLRARQIRYGEFYPLLLFATSGAMLMVSSTNLMVIFLGLEVMSLALYVMAGLARTEVRSEESAIKYFLLGAFASAFFLYGIALMYGAQGTVDLQQVLVNLSQFEASGASKLLMIASLALMVVGLGFKASLVPFHMWTPDVYQGAPTIATTYMSAVAKVAAFAVLIRVVFNTLPFMDLWVPVLWALSALSMVVGNLMALVQTDAKRMLAYSSVAHAGYLAIGLVTANQTGLTGLLFYLFAYSLMTIGAFGVLTLMARAGDATTMSALRGLYRRQPFAAHMMAILLLSLAGIPPTAGFWGKWYLFLSALEANQVGLAILLGLTSVVGASYYLRLAFSLYAEPQETPITPWRVPAPMVVCLLVCALGLVLLGIRPSYLAEPSYQASRQVQIVRPTNLSLQK
ncbi:MAG: NADH-quinone oxidoreductase subunit N [Fimbriimonadales bacterium]